MTKEQRAVAVVASVVKLVLNEILSQKITEHYSEAEWQEITKVTVNVIEEVLARDFAFNQILSESDICDKRGVVNATNVIEAIERMASQAVKPGFAPQLQHLAANMRHTFTTLKILKTTKEAADGQES